MSKKDQTEIIRLSIEETSSNSGQIASFILRSLEEGKNITMKYIYNGPSKEQIGNKVIQVLTIANRMLAENNRLNSKTDRILVTLPKSEKIMSDDNKNKITVTSIDFILLKK